MSIRTRIAHILGAPARYFHKMYLQADIMGWQADLEVASRQEVPMPELERILMDEIAHAQDRIDGIDEISRSMPPICLRAMWAGLADTLISRAMATPYFHLAGYMERYWVIPYLGAGPAAADGCGPVSALRRPVAWVLQRLGVAARVHHILRSDDDRAYHDHPWRYLTVVLRGGYVEVRPVFDGSGLYTGDVRAWHGPGSILCRPSNSWHRLELPEGTTAWTLFITGPKRQKWGFMPNPASKIPYEVYLKGDRKCS